MSAELFGILAVGLVATALIMTRILSLRVTIQALLKGTRDNLFQSLYIVGRVWLR